MHDPFPLKPPFWLIRASTPLANYLSLPTLPLHIHEVAFAYALYHFVQSYVSPRLSSLLFPSYRTLPRKTRINWDVHVVSLVQSLLVCGLALWVTSKDDERGDMNWQGRVWGYTGAGGLVQAFAVGYFLWDLGVSVRYVRMFGMGLLAHAVAALAVFSLGFRPFVNFYGPTFILYELSSPFLNIHWFCDKLALTGSTTQLINGVFLLSTFFLCRLVWGTYQSLRVFTDVFRAHSHGAIKLGSGPDVQDVGALEWNKNPPGSLGDPAAEMMRFAGDKNVPVWLIASYLGSNIVLNALNWFWFHKMIATIRKRFEPPLGTKRVDRDKKEDGGRLLPVGTREISLGRGVYADGHRSVEIQSTEVRKRRTGSLSDVDSIMELMEGEVGDEVFGGL